MAEDDEILSRFLQRYLTNEGFAVECAYDGAKAVEALRPDFDLLILDLDLPQLNGLQVLSRVRAQCEGLPVLVLTGRVRSEGAALTLQNGADDYVTKPFSCVELVARVHALLRRTKRTLARTLQCADLLLNRDEMLATRNGVKLDLTPREYDMLEFLMRTPRIPVPRTVLLKEVWSDREDGASNIVDVYVKYVRDKVDLPGLPKLIHTVRGLGYVVSEH